jgi:Ca2+-binding EF-hand superfamily protein
MNMLVKMATDKEVEDLRKQFVLLAKDGSGMTLASELSQALQKQNFKMSTADIN